MASSMARDNSRFMPKSDRIRVTLKALARKGVTISGHTDLSNGTSVASLNVFYLTHSGRSIGARTCSVG